MKKTLATVLFSEGYIFRSPEKGALLDNIERTDGKKTTAGDVRAVQAIIEQWNRRKK